MRARRRKACLRAVWEFSFSGGSPYYIFAGSPTSALPRDTASTAFDA